MGVCFDTDHEIHEKHEKIKKFRVLRAFRGQKNSCIFARQKLFTICNSITCQFTKKISFTAT
jgi:hypothetical protein